MTYKYEYDPYAPIEINVSESFKMDKQRATMGLTSDKLRERAIAGTAHHNGKAIRPVLSEETKSDL